MAQAPALPAGFELPLEPRLPRIGSVDAVALEERAASLAKRSIKKDAKVFALVLAIRTTDLTTLEGADTPGKVAALSSKAIRPDPTDPEIPSVAAICVYPNLVPVARERVQGTGVKVAAVATGFPSGQYPTALKVADVRSAVELGADEIDMVIDRGAFLSGRYAKVYDEIVQTKEACGEAHLKVILETGELGTYDNVRRATLLAIAAGADFVKTSTGDRAARRLQGRRRHPPGEAGGAAPRHRPRDSWPGLAHARPLPARRVVAPERHPHAAAQGEDRRLPVPRLLHRRLRWTKTLALVTKALHMRDGSPPTLSPTQEGGGRVVGRAATPPAPATATELRND